MKPWATLLAFAWCLSLHAHIGSPNVFLDGKAGDYPIRVIIRPPHVVPGLAEITVRVQEPVQRVSVLPIFWKAGRKGAPPPDEGQPVRGETNVYAAALWLMKPGAYSVEVNIEGSRGQGTLVVPVNSVATNTRPMSRSYGLMLSALGILLLLGGLKIAEAIAGQSNLEPGALPTPKDRRRGRVAMLLASAILFMLTMVGKTWWDIEDDEYRNESLYKRIPISARVRTDHDQHILTLQVNTSESRGRWTPLIPDHGKMMHLFLIHDGKPGAFAHLHPLQHDGTKFEAPLPPLPAGKYQVYADVTHEDGFSETLTAVTEIPPASALMKNLWLGNSLEPICSSDIARRLAANLFFPPDLDDSWQMDRVANASPPQKQNSQQGTGQRTADISGGYKMIWENPEAHVQNRETSLLFKLIAADNQPAPIEPYMGMAAHAVVRREDGTVFAHVHPSGTFSMAAQEFFITGKSLTNSTLDLQTTNSSIALPSHISHTNAVGFTETISFPYAFPEAGPYRIWVQTKSQGKILTAVFDTVIAKAK